jgi:PAS domain S-box-containing protein
MSSATADLRRKLLLIEDDRLDQLAFERFIKEGGHPYDYKISNSIAAGCRILAEQKFDLIVSDYQLADGTAMDILNLKLETPVIITTGTGNEEIAVQALRSGAVDYLIKDPERSYLKVLPATVEMAIKRCEMERSVAVLNFAVRSIKDSVFITDMEGRIFFVNQAFTDMYGYEESEVLGQSSRVLTVKNAVLPPERAGEFFQRRKNGEEFPVLLSSSVVKDDNGRAFAVVAVVHDITERKRLEKELEQSNRTLEVRVAERTNALQEKVKELQQLNAVMLGREERVLELKEELRLLREQLLKGTSPG